MLKRVLPWGAVVAVILAVVAVGVERSPLEAGTSLWRWRYILGSLFLVLLFVATWASGYDRGAKSVVIPDPVAPQPIEDRTAQVRVDASHGHTSIDKMKFKIRTITNDVMKPDHRDVEKAAIELAFVKRDHSMWYSDATHRTRDNFVDVVENILRVRRNNSSVGLYGQLNPTEAGAWQTRLNNTSKTLLDVLAEQSRPIF